MSIDKERISTPAINPNVALVGPRRVGKTTLARAFAETDEPRERRPVKQDLYLGPENPGDREKPADAWGNEASAPGRDAPERTGLRSPRRNRSGVRRQASPAAFFCSSTYLD